MAMVLIPCTGRLPDWRWLLFLHALDGLVPTVSARTLDEVAVRECYAIFCGLEICRADPSEATGVELSHARLLP